MGYMCKTKEEGALGLNKMQNQRGLCIKMGVEAFNRKNRLWAGWSRDNYLKGESYWVIKVKQSDLVLRKFLLKIKKESSQWITHHPGNDPSIPFWYSQWLPEGPISLMEGFSLANIDSRKSSMPSEVMEIPTGLFLS